MASVYVAYDAEGSVLYVGVTVRQFTRLDEHRKASAWWPQAHRMELEHFATPGEALARELELIRTLEPPFNTQGKPNPRTPRAPQMGPEVERYVLDEPLRGVGETLDGHRVVASGPWGYELELSPDGLGRPRRFRCELVFPDHPVLVVGSDGTEVFSSPGRSRRKNRNRRDHRS